jgi:hypothetical protein
LISRFLDGFLRARRADAAARALLAGPLLAPFHPTSRAMLDRLQWVLQQRGHPPGL